MSAKPRKIFIFTALFTAGIFFPRLVFAADGALTTTKDALQSKVEALENKLVLIRENQDALLKKQEEILRKLDTVKIWARRS